MNGFRSKPMLGAQRALIATDHRRGDDEQGQRERDLEDDERVTPALAHAIGRGDSAQRIELQAAGLEQRRSDAGEDARPAA